MTLTYKIDFKDGMFKYNCITHSSYIEIRAKDIKKIYNILNRLDILQKRAKKAGTRVFVYDDFAIIFDFSGYIKIENISNWLSIETEVPIIKRELIKYIKKYDTESVKDVIIKIKSLKKGSSNRIKEELK